MDTARKSDAESIDSVLNGDIDSFEALYGRYYSSMVAIAYSVLNDHHLAEDAAQEGFLKALRNLQGLRRKDRFAPWLARLCRNVAKDVAQANSKSQETDSVDVSELDPPERRVEGDMDRAVRQALNNLSASARELLVLRYYDNLSYEQISPVLGISKAAINSRLKRAKRKIAVYLHRNGLLEK